MTLKVLYILSDIEKALAFEWITDQIDRTKIELRFIVLGKSEDTELVRFLRERNVLLSTILLLGKIDMIRAWPKIFRIMSAYNPDVVHTHLYHATLLGLSAAWVLRVPKRIHTRHHASIHHQYFPKAVYIDKLINKLSTHIIVLSSRQKEIVVSWEKAPEYKVHHIGHGFDLIYFQSKSKDATECLRVKYNIPANAIVIGVIARYTEWKGIQYIIPAFHSILIQYPQAHLILANAQGDYAPQIKDLLAELPKGAYTEILFEHELVALYNLFTIYIHTPIDEYCEAFGQTYVESLATGVPSIFSISGIARDFIVHMENAIVVEHRNVEKIANGIEKLLSNGDLRTKLVEQGKISVAKQFSLDDMLRKLETLYNAQA